MLKPADWKIWYLMVVVCALMTTGIGARVETPTPAVATGGETRGTSPTQTVAPTTPTLTLTPTPAPTTPTATITPTPTLTPTPVITPLPTAAAFDFITSEQGWTYQSPSMFSTSVGAHSTATSGSLDITTSSNVNAFAFWESPMFEVGEGSASPTRLRGTAPSTQVLYRTDFIVASSLADRALAPTVRLRSSSADFAQSGVLVMTSQGAAELSPSTSERHYTQYFMQPRGQHRFRLDFEVLNFDPSNAESATLSLRSADLRYFDAEDIGSPVAQATVNLAAGESGFQEVTDASIPGPARFGAVDGLSITGQTTARGEIATPTLFGTWTARYPAQDFPGALFRLSWTVTSDATATKRSAVPTFRLRVNDASYKFAAYLNIESTADSLQVPLAGESQDYDLWFTLPPEIASNDLLLSFDYLHSSDGDNDPTITLTLTSITLHRHAIGGRIARRFNFH